MIGTKLFSRSWRSAVGVAILSLALTGCGGSGGSTTSTPQSSEAITTGNVSTTNGTTAAALTVTAPTGVTMSIPGQTTLTDGNGTAVTGNIQTSIGYSSSAADLPQAASQLPTGCTLAAFADVSMGTVKHFSQPVNLTINVPASSAKAGDAVTVYSFNSTTNAWTFAGTQIVDANGNVSPTVTHLSIWAVFKTATPRPVNPTGVSATAGDTQATVSWSAVTGATSYNVYYSTTTGQELSDTVPSKVSAPTTSSTVTGLTDGTTYYFVVTAVNANGESVVSNETSTAPVLPPPPAKPAGIGERAGDGQVTVSWTTITGLTYNIYYATASGQELSAGNPVTTTTASPTTVTGLTNGTNYYFVVTAVNAGGESAPSTEVSAAPATTPQPPATPKTVSVPTSSSTSPTTSPVHVSWGVANGATSYNVYVLASATQPANNAVLATTPISSGTTSATLTLTTGTYWVLITGVNAAGESGTQTNAKAIYVQ